jgi:NTP pyrophosphatase (non-canonical NTP hydrolase)
MDLSDALAEIHAFVAERDWSSFHDPKNLAMAIASEAGELVSLLRWVRSDEADAFVRDPAHRGEVEAEAADVAITLLLFCARAGIDLPRAIHEKMVVNGRNYPVGAARGRSDRPAR